MMIRNKIMNYKEKIICTIVILLVVFICKKYNIACVFYKLTGIPCFGCGMTRAITSFLHGNIAEAFNYHIMFGTMPILYGYFIFDGKLFKKYWTNSIILILIIIGFVLNWFRNIIYFIM